MTLEERKKQIKELESQIAKLKAQCEEPKSPHPRWKPAYAEQYYILWCTGAIEETCWAGIEIDNKEYDIGNVFRTKAEAEFAATRLKVIAEMREWAGHNYDGAYIYYHRPSDEIMIAWDGDSTCCFGSIHFKCIDDAENCVKAVGKDRIKKYYFMIPDNEEE